MRLFIAILFAPEIIAELSAAINQLRKTAQSGNFTRIENLHLTLAFIGETNRSEAAANILKATAPPPFALELCGSGSFVRASGDIVWAGLAKNNILLNYAENLCRELRNAGFDIDGKNFSPHITLGREVTGFKNKKLDVKPQKMEVNRISLMKSERINNKLIYSEISGVNLKLLN